MVHCHLQKDNCWDNPLLEQEPGLLYKNKYHRQPVLHNQAQDQESGV